MPMRKKYRPGPLDKCYGKFLDIDMFGEQINFNFQGRPEFNTCCGVLFTVMVLLITVGFGYLSAMRAMKEHEVPTILKLVEEEYFEAGRDFQVRQDSETDPFQFALAISSFSNFKKPIQVDSDADESASEESGAVSSDVAPEDEEPAEKEPTEPQIGTFSMSYLITGGPDDGKTFSIAFNRCTEADWQRFHFNHPSTRQQELIEAHIANDDFWCPDAFDLTFWGMKGDLDAKLLTIDFVHDVVADLEDKQILLLINNKRVVHDKNYETATITPHTTMHWLPLSADSPMLTTLTFTRERIYQSQNERQRLMGVELESDDFLSVREANIVSRPYYKRITNPFVAASIDFQLSHDLLIEAPTKEKNLIDAVAIAGGVYIILVTVIGFIFSCTVPYFMHLHIIRKLFKVDNNTGKFQSEAKLENKNHEQLVKEAKKAHRQRVRLTTGCCDSFLLIFESIIRILTCGKNKWSRTVREGYKQIKGELDIFNYMRRLRMTQATVNALTTFNQRRLLEAQVETSFLLQPLKKSGDADDDKKMKGRSSLSASERRRRRFLGQSSDEESEEDFAFLDQDMKDGKELDEISKRLLSGIIQAPPRRLKRFDKLTKEEIWERRKMGGTERGFGDLYDENDEDSDQYNTLENRLGLDGVDPGVSTRRNRRPKITQVSTDTESSALHPPCPDGFDADKWASMSLEEKCKYLGIDVKEWLKMNREQQMQRMHTLAKNFHFYAMDKVEDAGGKKKWHF